MIRVFHNAHSKVMKRVFLSLVLAASSGLAADWVVAEGGLSPDKRLAVVVYPKDGEPMSDEEGVVLLIDVQKQKRIGPLEETTSNGGGWGTSTKNVRCEWSPDGRMLLVNFRVGRLMQSYQVYRISGRRAIPLELPDDRTHPKGRIFDVLTTTSNPSSQVSFSKNGKLIKKSSGFIPKDGQFEEDYSKFGLKGFDGEALVFTYHFKADGRIQLTDIALDTDN